MSQNFKKEAKKSALRESNRRHSDNYTSTVRCSTTELRAELVILAIKCYILSHLMYSEFIDFFFFFNLQ